MSYAENDAVIYRESGNGPPRHGVVVGTAYSITELYIVKLPKVNGMTDCVTADETELSPTKKNAGKDIRYEYRVAGEKELEKEKR